MKLAFLAYAIFNLLIFTGFLAEAEPVHIQSLSPSAVPQFLYHWSGLKSLQRMAGDQPQTLLRLKTVTADQQIGSSLGALQGRPGLFMWSDPITGMGTSIEEMYAPTQGEPPVVVEIEVDPTKVKAIEVKTSGLERELKVNFSKSEQLALSEANLILHQWEIDGVVALKEWIVLDPKIIRKVTADPAILGKKIQTRWLEIEKTPRLSNEVLHWIPSDGLIEEINLFCYGRGRQVVQDVIRSYLNLQTKMLPPSFRGVGISCKAVFR